MKCMLVSWATSQDLGIGSFTILLYYFVVITLHISTPAFSKKDSKWERFFELCSTEEI